jgi:hypothetical protein
MRRDSVINSVAFTATTTAQKCLGADQSRPGSVVYIQAAAGATVFIGGDLNVTTTTGTQVPTTLAGGGPPTPLAVGGNDIWVIAAGSTNMRIMWVS